MSELPEAIARTPAAERPGAGRSVLIIVENLPVPFDQGGRFPVSYTHLTLPTNREV